MVLAIYKTGSTKAPSVIMNCDYMTMFSVATSEGE
jgi:hypothetical protein